MTGASWYLIIQDATVHETDVESLRCTYSLVKKGIKRLKGSKKDLSEELAINRRREDGRAEYEEMKREESSLEKKPLEFY